MRTEELKNNNFYLFFTNHYQWPVAHLLAYAHRPYQLIQHLNHFMRTQKLKNETIYIPFLTNHQQQPAAYHLACAHRLYQHISYLIHFMRIKKLKKTFIFIPFLTNHQQQSVAYHLAYAHWPYQLIQILVFICTSSKEINQQTPSEKKLFEVPFLSLQTISSGQSRIIQRTPTGLTNLSNTSIIL